MKSQRQLESNKHIMVQSFSHNNNSKVITLNKTNNNSAYITTLKSQYTSKIIF
ncbi:hypothetical protein Hanom_Chr16g01514171 [Helianthus anomalus]